jgi:hypothetical protein
MVVSVLRPDSVRDRGTWVDQASGTTNIYTSIDDAPDNDTTWITGTAVVPSGNSLIRLTLGTVSLAANQRVLRMRIRVRAGHNGSATQTQTVGASFWHEPEVNGVTWQSPLDHFLVYPPTTYKTLAGIWRPRDMLSREWSQAMVTNVQLALWAYPTHSGTTNPPRVSEAFVDCDIHDRPTVSGVTITANTTSSRPTVDWTYTANADGDPQVAYQVKAFSAAQYGVAGFDPSTAASSWDSGQVAGAGTTVVAGADLINSVTYKLYVRGAQDFNGARWFSDWAASSSFVMGFEPLPTPTLTVTPDNTVPHLRNLLVVDSKLNLLTSNDASFETGLGGWVAGAFTTIVTSVTQALKGAQSMRLTNTSGVANTIFANTAPGLGGYPVRAGTSYTALASFRAAVTGRSCKVRIAFYDGAGTYISDLIGGNVTDTTSGWTQATVTGAAPVGALLAALEVQAGTVSPFTANGEQHYVDAVSLSTSSATTWFTGGVASLDYQLVEFADLTPQHSVVVNLLNPQLSTGGELVNGPDGFFTRSAKDLVTFDRSLQVDGDGSIRWDVGNNTGSLLDIGTALGVYDPTYAAPCVPGTQYTFSCWVRASTGTHSLRLVLTSIDQSGAVAGSATNGSTNATIAQAWQRLTVTHTAQSGAVAMRPALENVNGDLVAYFLDSLQLEEGAAATPWHQGQGQFPAWMPVRGAKTALAADPRTNLAICFDREAAPGVIRLYRATNVAAYADGSMGVGPVSTYVATKLAIPTDIHILKDPQQPAHDLAISIRSLSHSIQEDLSEFHPVRPNAPGPIGFGQRPIVISDWIGGHDGTMELNISDEEDWYRVKQLLASKRTLLVQLAEGGQRYLRFKERSWSIDRIGPDGAAQVPSRYLRIVSVGFVEMARPAVLT